VHPDKIRSWIEAGELAAVDLAATRGRRPLYRISAEALKQFLERRQVLPRARPARSQKERLPDDFVRYYRGRAQEPRMM
jgi:hypothetical protein